MKDWLVATYKTNEIKRLEINLLNQKYNYYLPKITKKENNSNTKEEFLFPGYIFINSNLENYSALKYTIGIKNIIKFGENISCISDKEIEIIKTAEKKSKINPVESKIKIGQEVLIKYGSLQGNIVKICSLPYKERVNVFLHFLGSTRRVSISTKDFTV